MFINTRKEGYKAVEKAKIYVGAGRIIGRQSAAVGPLYILNIHDKRTLHRSITILECLQNSDEIKDRITPAIKHKFPLCPSTEASGHRGQSRVLFTLLCVPV